VQNDACLRVTHAVRGSLVVSEGAAVIRDSGALLGCSGWVVSLRLFLGDPLVPEATAGVVVIQAAYPQALISPDTRHFLLVAVNRDMTITSPSVEI
jgi:hypothetical protein